MVFKPDYKNILRDSLLEEKGIKSKVDAQVVLIREVIIGIGGVLERDEYENMEDLASKFISFLVDSHLEDRCINIMGKRYYDLDADKIVISRSVLENISMRLHYVGNYFEDTDIETRDKVKKDINKAVDELEEIINPKEKNKENES